VYYLNCGSPRLRKDRRGAGRELKCFESAEDPWEWGFVGSRGFAADEGERDIDST